MLGGLVIALRARTAPDREHHRSLNSIGLILTLAALCLVGCTNVRRDLATGPVPVGLSPSPTIAPLVEGWKITNAYVASREGAGVSAGANLSNREMRGILPMAFLPDNGYSIVHTEWLRSYYRAFRRDLFSKDIVGWEGRFDCNKFAAAYASGAQMRFFREQFHSRNQAQAAAVGEAWYRGPVGPHAVNIAITENGLVFIDPQTGKFLTLSPEELASIYYVRF